MPAIERKYFKMDSILLYVKESYNELLHKVTWPSFAELLNSTTVVLIASAIIAIVVLIMDAISKNVLKTVFELGL